LRLRDPAQALFKLLIHFLIPILSMLTMFVENWRDFLL
jgi:hypothetical protein